MDAVCFNGNTALHIACGQQNSGMVALLMAAGANPEIENSEALKTDAGSEDEEDGEGDKAVPGHKPCHYAAGNTRVSHMTELLKEFSLVILREEGAIA